MLCVFTVAGTEQRVLARLAWQGFWQALWVFENVRAPRQKKPNLGIHGSV